MNGFGYQLGAGIEHAINDSWTVKLDYTYLDFGNASASAVVGGDPIGAYYGQTKTVEAGLAAHIVKIGFNYRF